MCLSDCPPEGVLVLSFVFCLLRKAVVEGKGVWCVSFCAFVDGVLSFVLLWCLCLFRCYCQLELLLLLLMPLLLLLLS